MSMPNKINNGPSLIHKITVSECVYGSFFFLFGLVWLVVTHCVRIMFWEMRLLAI